MSIPTKSNVIVQGFIGSGKTESLLTLLKEYVDRTNTVRQGAGKTLLYTGLEPGYQHIFRSHGCEQGLHTHYHISEDVDWDTISFYVKLLNTMSFKDVIDTADPRKRNYTGWLKLITEVCKAWTCDVCGQDFGDISALGPEFAVAFDSLSPMSTMIQQAVCGGKPVPSKPEYFGMLGFALAFFRAIFMATKCTVVVTAHIDKEIDAVTGDTTFTLDTIGQRLVKQIVKMPDELVTAYEEEGKFYWSNLPGRTGHVLKRRALPRSDSLPPDFTQVFKETDNG